MRAPFRLFAAAIALAGFAGAQAEEKLGRLIVKVTEAGTGKPVAGATIHPNIGSGLLEPIEEREALTDENGRLELPVPLGNLRILSPMPPAGYWMARKMFGRMQFEQVALTRQQPVIERTYEAIPAVLWPAKVVARSRKPAAGVHLRVSSNSFLNAAHGGGAITDAEGNAKVTLPRDGGDLWVSCSGGKPTTEFTSRRVQLEVAPDFDHTHVVSVGPADMGDRIVLVDRMGRRASCAGCTAALSEGVAHLVFEVQDPPGPEFAGEVVGRVVDESGQPIRGATVMCSSAAMTEDEYKKQTNERGEFQFRSLFKWSPPAYKPAFGLWIIKEGFARQEVEHFFTPGADGVVRLEPLVLKPAYSAKVRVLDADGEPVEGAWLTSGEGDHNGNKSDRDGYCTLRNLPVATVAVGVSFGDQSGSVKIDVTPATARWEAIVVQLHKRPADLAGPAPRPPAVRLELSRPAPEWNIEQWTDGKQHTLAELRGKVVVIEFWDYGCKPCREITLPVSQILQARYTDVAFVHINPAGSQPHLVKELLKLQGWSFVVGFDKGTKSTDGETLKRYGVTGYSTIMILDREGRVVMNSALPGDKAQDEAYRKAIAAAAGLPWPVEKDASQEELIRRQRRFHEQWMTTEIEKALEAK